jgi:maltooligosyltrehalose synthase
MYKDVSRWMGAVHEIEKSHSKQKQRFFNKSVQEEALQSWSAMKQIKKQREELRLYMLSQNPQAWSEFVQIEGQIRKDRLRAEQRRKARIKKNIEIIVITTLMICIGAGLWFLVWFAMKAKGLL